MGLRMPVLSNLSIAKNFVIRLCVVLVLIVGSYFVVKQILPAQISNGDRGKAEYNTIQARESFRLGVNAFNHGFYNRSIMALEHSLALRPENPDAVFWLGRSYYASGYVRLGLEQWKTLIDQNQATASLKSFYNTLDYRYRQVSKLRDPDKYSLFMSLHSNKRGVKRSVYFVGPTSVWTALDRDEIYIVDYTDNKVIALDSSGNTKFISRGSLSQAYDHPFDILLRPKGEGFILSQEGSNSLLFCDEKGRPYKEVGGKGNAPGKFLGPQHMVDSGDGYFYVTDWGNRRIAKLDYNGNFIFTFGASQGRFAGLQGPTGMVIRENKLYVADTLQRKIFVFSQEGQYLETFIDSGLTAPESLLVTREGNLLIADVNEIKSYDFNTSRLKTIYTGDQNHKYIDLNYDRNQNIVIVDFNNEEISFITPINKLYTDLFVQIDRILTSEYPSISIDLLLEDREGIPIVGLNKENFQVIESNKSHNADLVYTSVEDPTVALAIILGSKIAPYEDAIRQLVSAISGSKQLEDSFMLIQGGKDPRILTNSTDALNDRLDNYEAFDGIDSAEANFDISLRFAIDSLVKQRKKRVIVFVSGDADQIAAEVYNISDLQSYLKLQNANMYGVLSKSNKIISYLVENTNGQFYTDANVRSFAKDIQLNRDELAGYYTLNFTSTAYTDLARRYIPVEVLVRYVRRSGKDELGYFAPLSSLNANP